MGALSQLVAAAAHSELSLPKGSGPLSTYTRCTASRRGCAVSACTVSTMLCPRVRSSGGLAPPAHLVLVYVDRRAHAIPPTMQPCGRGLERLSDQQACALIARVNRSVRSPPKVL